MTRSYLLILVKTGREFIDSADSVATVPLQREAGRAFCSRQNLSIVGETIQEDEFVDQEVEHFVSTLEDAGCSSLVVTNLDLFNRSGVAAQLLPRLKDAGICVDTC